MLKKILIANRGEIACRIIRTARRLGVATVAVYSDADAKALHVEQADAAVHIGPSPAPESYLRGDRIIAAAKAAGAEAIHPGYGFLSENADFADAATKAGLKFIGPSAAAMRALGGKAAAKEIAMKAGVPVVPGYQGERQDARSLAVEARKIGYPVMIKAVAGGGGRGMRLVPSEAELAELLASAQREAEGAFGDGRVLIEKVVERPRHIEVQVFGDGHGNVVHLFERDCTLQRRNQKVVEEAPAPGMTAELRERMCAAAVKLAGWVGYEGAGTVEFLVEGDLGLGANARWYFIEMNTRLQVEHPVTEEITGLDLVEWQLRVASGEPLPLAQDAIRMRGHAIEVRLCAEDPAKGFLPSIGRIATCELRGGPARYEIAARPGEAVSPFYDSMIGKLIVRADDRPAALEALIGVTEGVHIGGLATNQRFLTNLLAHPVVRSGGMDTGLIGRELAALASGQVSTRALVDGIANHLARPAPFDRGPCAESGPWSERDAFVLGPARPERRLRIAIDGAPREIAVRWERSGAHFPTWKPHVTLDGIEGGMAEPHGPETFTIAACDASETYVFERGLSATIAPLAFDPSAIEDGAAGSAIRAPINGRVARIFVAEGAAVEKGARIAVVEAMKMEHVLHASRAGTIAKVAASEGQQVTQGSLIASLADEPAP